MKDVDPEGIMSLTEHDIAVAKQKAKEFKLPNGLKPGEARCVRCSRPSKRAWLRADGLCLGCRRKQLAARRAK